MNLKQKTNTMSSFLTDLGLHLFVAFICIGVLELNRGWEPLYKLATTTSGITFFIAGAVFSATYEEENE